MVYNDVLRETLYKMGKIFFLKHGLALSGYSVLNFFIYGKLKGKNSSNVITFTKG